MLQYFRVHRNDTANKKMVQMCNDKLPLFHLYFVAFRVWIEHEELLLKRFEDKINVKLRSLYDLGTYSTSFGSFLISFNSLYLNINCYNTA